MTFSVNIVNTINMVQPTPYAPTYSFTDHASSSPGTQPPGVPLDTEFNNISSTVEQIINNLSLIQRDDTTLRSNSVGINQLDGAAIALIKNGTFDVKGVWEAGRAYALGDFVAVSDLIYVVVISHTSGVFATDLSANKLVKAFNTSTGTANVIVPSVAFATLSQLKAADAAVLSYSLTDPDLAGIFFFQTIGAPYVADDVDIIKLNSTSLSVGALVRHTRAIGEAPDAGGVDAISGYLTNDSVQLASLSDGTIVSYTAATGSFRVFSGTQDVSSLFTLSTPTPAATFNPQSLSVTYSGLAYSVTGGFDTNEATASLTIRATGSGAFANITIDKVFTLARATKGYEIVSVLPTTNLFEGRIVFLTTDGKLYRYAFGAWTTAVAAIDITGQLANAQIAALAASKITGQLTDAQLAQIAAAKIAGQLTDAQIASIAAAKLTGQITATQITDNSISTAKLSAGSVTAEKIAADTITASQIAASAITATELAAGSVVAGKIAAGAILAGTIAAGAITATELAAGSVTAGKIATGAILAGTIAANAITANEIAANAVTASELAASAVTADKISTGAVTAAKINVASLSAITATIGTLRTATTGARTEISDNLIQIFDANNVRRVRLGVWT